MKSQLQSQTLLPVSGVVVSSVAHHKILAVVVDDVGCYFCGGLTRFETVYKLEIFIDEMSAYPYRKIVIAIRSRSAPAI